MENNGFIYIPSGVYFKNRKQAIKTMGNFRYRKELSKKNFKFNSEESDKANNKAEINDVTFYDNDSKQKFSIRGITK